MEKIFNEDRYPIIAVILSSIASFFLGGLFVYSLYNPAKIPTKVVLTPAQTEITVHTRVYASSRGKRYYPWWCDAGSTIAKENMVWYDAPGEAKKAGYTIAKSCGG